MGLLESLFAKKPPAPKPPRPGERLTLAKLFTLEPRLPREAWALIVRELCHLIVLEPDPRFVNLAPDDVWLVPDGTLRIGREPMHGGRQRMRYLSPESMRGQFGEGAVVYTLGALLWEAVAQRPLHAGKTDFELLERIRLAPRPERPEQMPTPVYDVLVRALEPSPAERYASLAELSAALAPLQGSLGRGTFKTLIAAHLPAPQLAEDTASIEASLVNAIARGDDGARHVYADWLLEAGRTSEARWLQLEGAVRTATGDAQLGLLAELKRLQKKVPGGFVASVARQPLEACPVKFGFQCPLKWTSLERTANENVRWCKGCHSEVHYCTSIERAQELGFQGVCVAVDLTVHREEHDLLVERLPGMTMGRVAW